MHILLFSHSHASSLTRSHTHTLIHPNPSRDIIALCNIPTTLCCLVHSDMIPLHRRNRKPGRKGFTKQICGSLYKHATSMHLTCKNIHPYTPNINHQSLACLKAIKMKGIPTIRLFTTVYFSFPVFSWCSGFDSQRQRHTPTEPKLKPDVHVLLQECVFSVSCL